MPDLVRLYIRNVAVGFALSAIFVGALLGLNVANLWHLVSTSPMGWVAGLMLFVFNGIVFAGVQFGIVIMRMGDRGGDGGRGRRMPVGTVEPALAHAAHGARGARRRH